ncbi:hypothetical protein DSO57_1008191 [Entomophthora muscae]|uniref:Uncharacterized protein n=1 Tax=Entomophthora muscae TaxID=34485 RepID=A0ACC2U4W1_9FUNG|nr:hypothetical protein DSO57_1008191 [Entomophthora muscae]
MQEFIVTFQECANAVLAQHVKSENGSKRVMAADTFHRLIGIPTFEAALTLTYAAFICKEEPNTLKDAYNLMHKQYTIYVECKIDKYAHAASIWNPFIDKVKVKKEAKLVKTMEAKFKELNSKFESLFLAQTCAPRSNQDPPCQPSTNYTCYNCNEVGHVSRDCTRKCSICKQPDHSNFCCPHCYCPGPGQHPHHIMMAEHDYENEKRGLSSSASPNPMNKKTNSDYFVDPSDPHFDLASNQFLFKMFNKRYIRSQGPSPDHSLTPPLRKRTDREDTPSPESFCSRAAAPEPPNFDEPPATPSPPRLLSKIVVGTLLTMTFPYHPPAAANGIQNTQTHSLGWKNPLDLTTPTLPRMIPSTIMSL